MRAGLKKLGVLLGIMALVTVVGVLITVGVNRDTTNTADTKQKLRVVTSFYPMYIATMNIVDNIEGVELTNLTENKGGCLHDYQLTTADLKKLENADVLIINGGGMEQFLDKVLERYPKLSIIDASEGILEGHNAHFWMSPKMYEQQLANIVAGLSHLDETHQAVYEENGQEYIEKIAALEERLLSAITEIPKEKAILFHDAFEYLAEQLGIEVVYSIELEEDTALNTGEIAEIVDKVKAEQVGILFTEKQFSDSIPAGISRETGASICVVDTLVSGELKKEAYLEGMNHNLEAILQCIQALE